MFNEIIFFTSSRIKLAHAKYICRFFDVNIVSFHEKYYMANYVEPRSKNRDYILRKSFESASEQARKAGFYDKHPFIIEDTSVIIKALSRGEEYPGVDVKYWMEETNFEDVDLELGFSGGDRSVVVRSDLLLHIPGMGDEWQHYIGLTEGSLVTEEIEFDTNPFYPWLDSKTFNKWFVPGGESNSISRLPIDVANSHDFRRKSFEEMLNDLHSGGWIRKSEIRPVAKGFDEFAVRHLVLINGLTCSGKTTGANFLAEEYGYLHVEASDFMHMVYRERFGFKTDVKIGQFAAEILKENPCLVVDLVIDYINKCDAENVVVTGFRLKQEVEKLLEQFRSEFNVELVYVDASVNNRSRRKKIRNRDKTIITSEDLEDRDSRELEMGLEKISEMTKAHVPNNGTTGAYNSRLARRLSVRHSAPRRGGEKRFEEMPLRYLILLCLFKLQDGNEGQRPSYTTTQIAKKIKELYGIDKSKNNVSRFFNQRLMPYYEVSDDGGRKTYSISNTGIGLARFIYKNMSKGV